MSVIVGRACRTCGTASANPPPHPLRHVEDSLTYDHPFRKCATAVGDVLGRYHHGDANVYDALVRLAQDFSMRCITIDGHAFGSVDGDPDLPVHEARMSHRRRMLRDIDKETVDWDPSDETARAQGPPPVLQPAGQRLFRHRRGHSHQHLALNMREVISAVICVLDDQRHIVRPDAARRG